MEKAPFAGGAFSDSVFSENVREPHAEVAAAFHELVAAMVAQVIDGHAFQTRRFLQRHDASPLLFKVPFCGGFGGQVCLRSNLRPHSRARTETKTRTNKSAKLMRK
jgi:hypothetical protein